MLLGLFCSLLGCVALSADTLKEIAKAHQEVQKTGICEVHKIKMSKEAVRIHWAEAIRHGPYPVSIQLR